MYEYLTTDTFTSKSSCNTYEYFTLVTIRCSERLSIHVFSHYSFSFMFSTGSFVRLLGSSISIFIPKIKPSTQYCFQLYEAFFEICHNSNATVASFKEL